MSVILNTFLIPMNMYIENLILKKLTMATFYSQFFFIILVVFRIKWEQPPKLIYYLGIGWFFVLLISMFLQQNIEFQDNISFIKKPILLFEMAELYRIFAAFLIFYAAYSEKPIKDTQRVNRCILGWKLVGLLLMLCGVFNLFVWSFFSNVDQSIEFFWLNLFSLTLLFVMMVIVWMAVFFPEALLFTQAQILRAIDLYETIQNLDSDQAVKDYGMNPLIDYLKSLPPDLISELKIRKQTQT
ncbi:MAG: hypothetical protein ACXAC7_06360 [Candidatus Hodarchaeales archaeon]